MPDFDEFIRVVEGAVPDNATIMANGVIWLGLQRNVHMGWEQLVYHQYYDPESDLEGAFEAFRPDYLVVDGLVRSFVSRERPARPPIAWFLHIPEDDLAAFLNRRATLVAHSSNSTYGEISVYRLNWSSD